MSFVMLNCGLPPAGDSANTNNNTSPSSCGNGIVEGTEACDPGSGGYETATCNNNCTLSACGDSMLNYLAGEQCEDGNALDDGNGCSTTCQFVGDQYEPNDTTGTAKVIPVDGTIQDHGATAAAEPDFFSVTISDLTPVYEFCKRPSLFSGYGDASISLLGTDGITVLQTQSVTATGSRCLFYKFGATGTYFIKILSDGAQMYKFSVVGKPVNTYANTAPVIDLPFYGHTTYNLYHLKAIPGETLTLYSNKVTDDTDYKCSNTALNKVWTLNSQPGAVSFTSNNITPDVAGTYGFTYTVTDNNLWCSGGNLSDAKSGTFTVVDFPPVSPTSLTVNNTATSGSMSTNDQFDWYTVSVFTGNGYTINSAPAGNVETTVFRSTGAFVTLTGTLGSLTFNGPGTETLYIRVSPKLVLGSVAITGYTGGYTVQVTTP